jgi:hypothetical protein
MANMPRVMHKREHPYEIYRLMRSLKPYGFRVETKNTKTREEGGIITCPNFAKGSNNLE